MSPWRDASNLPVVLAPTIILLALLANLLTYHLYSIARIEVLLAALCLFAVGTVFGLLATLRNKLLCPLVLLVFVILFIDLYSASFDLSARIRPTEDNLWTLASSLLAFFIAFAVFKMLQRHLAKIVCTVFGVVLISTLLIGNREARLGQVAGQPQDPDPILPPVVHLVTDEFIGLGGLPRDIPGLAGLADELAEFYPRQGFRVFDQAYSRFSQTKSSLAALLNGITEPDDAHRFEDGPLGLKLSRNRWFERLQKQGYAIRVYQNSWMDFCGQADLAIESCHRVWAHSIQLIEDQPVAPLKKAELILGAYIDNSKLLRILMPRLNHFNLRLGAFATEGVLRRMVRDIREFGGGRVYFAHLLSPHYSYVFDADCRPKPDLGTWQTRFGLVPPQGVMINNAQSRRERYLAYGAQLRCVHRQLGRFLEDLRTVERFEEMTIIIHGDHGSRISLIDSYVQFSEQLSLRDLIDNHSTHFAFRRPGTSAGLDARAGSIQGLFAETFLGLPVPAEDDRILPRGNNRDSLGSLSLEMPQATP